MEIKGLLPLSQELAIVLYHESAESSRPIDPYLPKVYLNAILPPTPRSSQWSLFFRSPNQNPVNTFPLLHACHMSSPPHP